MYLNLYSWEWNCNHTCENIFLFSCGISHTCENAFVLLLVAMHLYTYFWEQSCTHMSGKRFVLFLVGMHLYLYLWEWCCTRTHDHKFAEFKYPCCWKIFLPEHGKKGGKCACTYHYRHCTSTNTHDITLTLQVCPKQIDSTLQSTNEGQWKYTVHGKWNVLLLLKTSISKCDRPNETLP